MLFYKLGNLKNLKKNIFKLSRFHIFKRKKMGLSNFLDAEIKVNLNIRSSNPQDTLKSFQEKHKHISISLLDKSQNFDLNFSKDNFKIKIDYSGTYPIPELEKQLIEAYDDNEVKLPDKLCQFRIFITKKENTEGMIIDAFSYKSNIYILYIKFDENIFKRFDDFKRGIVSEKFVSPSLEKIERFLKKDLVLFLEDIGINQNLLSFIEEFSKEREKLLYIEWLKDVKEKIDYLEKRI